MYELIQVGKSSYYMDCPAKVGVYTYGDGTAVTIDSGSDEDDGRRVLRLLEKLGVRLTAILSTHSNADHIGGNAFLQSRTGCRVYAHGAEAAVIRYTELGPALVFGGYPFSELRQKSLYARPCDVLLTDDPTFPDGFEIIPLPGHFFDMVGYRSPDDVVYLADCIFSRETLDKYGLPFIYDVARFFETLDRVEKLDASRFVPAHAPASDDVTELVRCNRQKIADAGERIFDACAEPVTFEDILKQLFDSYDIPLNYTQYALVGNTLRSFLAWLKDSGRITGEFCNNRLYWRQV